MSDLTYSEKLKDPRWQKRRLEIMQRDDFACRYCGDKNSTLNVHHLEYSGDPWDAPGELLITLCEKHHDKLHNYEKIVVIDQGVLSPYDFINLSPSFINLTLSYIENHKGTWVIQFREDVNPYQIIKLSCLLFRFITPTDCNIDVRILIDKGYFKDVDIYQYLNEITITIAENNG